MRKYSQRYEGKLMNKPYKIRYLPLFESDLEKAVIYISENLQNPQSAKKLIDEVEKAINQRLFFPTAFEPFNSSIQRKNEYYKIMVRNYYIFYVVIDDVMEVRRFIYNRRNLDSFLP